MKNELKRMAGLEEDEFTAILVVFLILGAVLFLFIRGCGAITTSLPIAAGEGTSEIDQTAASDSVIPVIVRGEAGPAAGSYRFEGTGQPGARLVMMADDTRLGTARVRQNGTWVFETDRLENGLHTLTAHPQTDKTIISNGYPVTIFHQAEKPDPRSFALFGIGNRQNDQPSAVADVGIVSEPKNESNSQRPADADNGPVDGSSDTAAAASTAVPEPLPTVMLLATVEPEPEPEPTEVEPTTPAVMVEITDVVTFGPIGRTVVIRGVATPNSEVTLSLNGNQVGLIPTDGSGNWSFSGYFPSGSHTLSAGATLNDLLAESAPVSLDLGEPVAAEGDGGLRIVYPADVDPTTLNNEQSQSGPADIIALDRPVVELILDASWSMTFPLDSSAEEDRLTADDPNSRIAIAKAALLDLITRGTLEKRR